MRSATFIAVAASVALLLAAAVGVYAYDASNKDKIAEGVTVGGVAVGGLEREDAARRVRDELLRPLSAPVVVRAVRKQYRLTAREARIAADVNAMVDAAVAAGRDGNIFARTARALTGDDVDEDVEPRITYSEPAVARLVARIRRGVEDEPRNARVDFTADGLKPKHGRHGHELDARRLTNQVEAALTRPGESRRVVDAKVRRIAPEVESEDLAGKYETVITINRGAFRLRLFKRLKHVKTYRIAVGQVGLETPAGMYKVQNKAVNPTWNVPKSDWAGELAGRVIPPGPENPLKARWMGIYDGAGIHGTDAVGSIGTNASHGCIRMLIPDVIELYDKVPVGAPVYII